MKSPGRNGDSALALHHAKGLCCTRSATRIRGACVLFFTGHRWRRWWCPTPIPPPTNGVRTPSMWANTAWACLPMRWSLAVTAWERSAISMHIWSTAAAMWCICRIPFACMKRIIAFSGSILIGVRTRQRCGAHAAWSSRSSLQSATTSTGFIGTSIKMAPSSLR